jgi:hypothetical protein
VRALYHDPLNPLFRQLTGPDDYRAVLLAALLHDVGQFPLAHDLEDIEPRMFNHRTLVKALIQGVREEKLKGTRRMEFPPLDAVFADWNVKRETVLGILEAKLNDPQTPVVRRILKSIISGPVDADKLDYLIRDGKRLGVPYPEGIDVERLLRCLTVVVKPHMNGVQAFVGIHEKALVPAEFVTMARYAMFSQVYWHHGVRAAVAMLSRAMAGLFALQQEPELNRLRSDWEEFVLYGPEDAGEPEEQPLIPGLDANPKPERPRATDFVRNLTGSNLNAWDRATLKFLLHQMEKINVVEAELVRDLLSRRLYKRVFSFGAADSPKTWEGFTVAWDSMTTLERQSQVRVIEANLLDAVKTQLTRGTDTAYLSAETKKSLEVRLDAKLPVLIVDVPNEGPGSSVPLTYVVEEDRRGLRKSNRMCGRTGDSRVWPDFAQDLRRRAGRIRVFAHPEYADMVLSAIPSQWMEQALSGFKTLEAPTDATAPLFDGLN